MPATTVKELAELLQAPHTGAGRTRITGVATLSEAGAEDISWASEKKYAGEVAASKAGAVVVGKDFGPTPMPAIVVDQPELAIIAVLQYFAPPPAHPKVGRHPTAVIATSAQIDDTAAVGANVFVDENVRIGRNTILYPNVYVGYDSEIGDDCVLYPCVVIRDRCRIGNRVVLHPNASIGADGFGYQFHDGRHHKIPQIGSVVIEDDVEVGAGACIDRAKVGRTVVGRGTKIDNLVQIAHNVRVGQHCMLVAQVGIAGSTSLGNYVVLGGKVGVRDHISIGDGVQTAACSCISRDVSPGQVLMGIPAYDAKKFFKDQAQLRRLDQYIQRINDLTERVKRLESATDH